MVLQYFYLQIKQLNSSLFRSSSVVKKIQEKKAHKMEVRLAKLIWAIVIIFIVCNIFQNITYILQSEEIIEKDFYRANLSPVRNILVAISTSCNVIIYGIFNNNFRREFVSLFWKCESYARDNSLKSIVVSKSKHVSIPMIKLSNHS